MDKLAVIIPCLNNFEGLADTISSIVTEHPWQVYIIDNWRNPERSVAASWNKGIQHAINDGFEYFLILNDDIILSRLAPDRLYEAIQPKKTGLVSCSQAWNSPQEMKEIIASKEIRKRAGCHFSAFMLKKESFEDIGLFDENFKPAYHEDGDYHYRSKLAGWESFQLDNIPFYHFGSTTGKASSSEHSFESGKAYYRKKWGNYPPGQEIFKTPYNKPELTYKDWSLQ